MQLRPSRQAVSSAATQEFQSIFIEPETLLLCSKKPSTYLHPETDESSPYHDTPVSPSFILILSTHIVLCLPIGLFPSGIPTNNLFKFLT
jgi:hypothetical protein